ncbi:HWE histidine kinase domain-containing protein [Puniceibacterium sediminis]|uniref:histidine kinase n=1 Tax=Puniceibacterium sediminis TaxID=1608407 RepID=A0A238VJW5_9RHOB|nr:HWE histidine kinase domain-containing protein [Puniceibacterium sediminis]SNR33789.1 PAS domain S-box-containing protein [Puniceibacterium sediminis]
MRDTSADMLDFVQVFKHVPAPCLVLDRDMKIVTASDSYLDVVQRSMEELRGKFVFDAFPEEPERLEMLRGAFQKALNGEKNSLVKIPFSIPIDTPDGPEMREIWWTSIHHPVPGPDGEIRFMIQKALDVTQEVKAERLKETIAAELQHRVGNILSLVSVIARRTANNADDLPDFLNRFEGRLQALARTHSYLTGNNWDRMTIESILSRQLADHFEADAGQIDMMGGEIHLTADEAQILTLAVHELTTNSVKYGALKNPEGRLAIKWNRIGPSGYDLEWREGGILVEKEPERSGFGSMILDTIVPRQLQAEAVREFSAESFVYRLSVPERSMPV